MKQISRIDVVPGSTAGIRHRCIQVFVKDSLGASCARRIRFGYRRNCGLGPLGNTGGKSLTEDEKGQRYSYCSKMHNDQNCSTRLDAALKSDPRELRPALSARSSLFPTSLRDVSNSGMTGSHLKWLSEKNFKEGQSPMVPQ